MCFSFKSDIHPDELKGTIGAVSAKKSFEIFYQENPEGFGSTIFPNTYAISLIHTKHGPTLVPMRYRVRPSGSEEEIPSKYNLYNARQESILLKKTWSSLIGRNHVAIPMNAFNEWVTTESGKKIVQFRKRNTELFWVAGLFDIWENPENKTKLISFAIITTEPTDYIKTVGHDRCPIILSESEAIEWIKIKSDPNSAFDYLPKSMNKIEFSHEFTVV